MWQPIWLQVSLATEPPFPPEQLEFFEKKVRPLLAEHCYSCHSNKSKKLQASLKVDSRAGLLRGGDSGEAIVPGDPDASLFMEAVRYESYEMPPKGKLSADDIETFRRWVELGAPWPEEEEPAGGEAPPEFDIQRRKTEHWVWHPPASPAAPEVADRTWPQDDLDHFILAKLESSQLHPAVDADRRALLRRLYFDLIGLPPTTQQTERFLADDRPQALERLVDQLLDSPHFGERWGRHWLDLVRYAESRGHEFDHDAPNAYQYRDYVIRALNADVPYDQLVREHIAGDLLNQPRLNPQDGFNESILGTGFWFLGEWVHSPVDIRKDESDRFDNMIDVMSKTFLGVTVSCARCHDHKFDAISTADYYSLSGFLQSSDYRQVRFESLDHNRRVAQELAEIDRKYQDKIHKRLAAHDLGVSQIPHPAENLTTGSVVFDPAALPADQYLQDGFVFGSRPRRAGEAFLDTRGDQPQIRFAPYAAATSDSFWDGLESVSEKGVQSQSKLGKLPRSGRTLRTASFKLTHGRVACRVQGAGHVFACVDSHRLVAGPLHGQTIREIKPAMQWVELDLSRYLGHRLHLEFTPARDASLEVSFVLQGADDRLRQRLVEHQDAMTREMDVHAKQAKRILAAELESIAKAWAKEREVLRGQVRWRSRLAMAMIDGTGENDHVLIRGNSSKPGELAPRRFLSVIAGEEAMSIATGSGRLELARQINDPGNPLTARVIVNRIWHHLMGRGIVPTTDDFGVLGQRPTHPELLDHLATRFVQEGRSIKKMIRLIVLSRTYQMSAFTDPAALAADPKNLMWHHRPPKRLEGEVIRDALLSLAGKLDTTQFGEPIPIHLTSFMDGRGRPRQSGPLDGAGRRSIYTAVRRNFLSPFMLTFDTPVPFSTMGRRNVSNVPAQALILMNDPLVARMARHWAEKAMQQHPTVSQRIEGMYQAAFARPPTEHELAAAQRYLRDGANDPEIWTDFAHALINTKEFIFLR
ncbi:MAG: PSD1 and planctomycete cytochrome C domain-containing protein [Pirellulales bacterium]|nr:PSD1 and planctomycete cytochrome C domain-containing protein [Pirellulales bacterium]